MKLTFKSGRTIQIGEHEAKVLARRIVNGCAPYQTFERKEDDFPYMILNLEELESITED